MLYVNVEYVRGSVRHCRIDVVYIQSRRVKESRHDEFEDNGVAAFLVR